MRPRWLAGFLLALAIIGTWFLARRSEPAGPLYSGKTVKHWVQKFTRHPRRDANAGFRTTRDSAPERLQEIGTNAIPFLLLELDYEAFLPDAVRRVLTFGTRNHGQTDVRVNAELGVKQIGPAALPVLFHLLESSDRRMRKGAVSCLAHFHRDNPEVIPALIRSLRDTEFSVRGHAASALGNVGPDAQIAIPPLLNWLKKDPSFVTLLVVSSAVRRIDPENADLRAALSEFAAATKILGLSQGEVRSVNQHASRILAELKGAASRGQTESGSSGSSGSSKN